MGVPLCLSSAVDEKTEQENIIYGDDSGAAIMLQCGRGELPARVLKPGEFTYVHDEHSDWVTQVGASHVIHKPPLSLKGWDLGFGKHVCTYSLPCCCPNTRNFLSS